MNDAENKITRMDIITSAILITIIVSSTLYGFENIKLPKLHITLTYLIGMVGIGIPIMAHYNWLNIVKNIGNDLKFKKKLFYKTLSVLVYFSVVTLIWVSPSSGLYEALMFRLGIFDWFEVGIVVLISYYVTKETSFNNIFTSLIWSTAFIHLIFLYWSFGYDDGCVTIGADPLFGGGGEVDCDPDYVKREGHVEKIANKYSFNEDSLFAVDFLILCLTSYLSIIAGYLKRKFHDKTE